jgi:hypothetical protein
MNREAEPERTPRVACNDLLGVMAEPQNGNECRDSCISENQGCKLPSQWNLSDWLREMELCPSLLPAKMSPDRKRVEELLAQWIERGRPNLEVLPEISASASP